MIILSSRSRSGPPELWIFVQFAIAEADVSFGVAEGVPAEDE
jgi:hypothetical protein